MLYLRRTIALLLLAVWLPATLHCEVEAAEIALHLAGCTETDATDHHHDVAPENCIADNCATVEGSFTANSSSPAAARAPVVSAAPFIALVSVPAFALSPPPVTGVIEALAAPPQISRSWIFVLRAAPWPGAPSLS